MSKTTDQERDAIKKQMEANNLSAGRVIVKSEYTGLRNFLNGGKITLDKLNDVKSAIAGLIADKKTSDKK